MRNFAITLVTILAIACFGCATKSVDDATLTATVKSKLAADRDTSALSINVDTSNSVVTLNGTVASATEKSRAEQIAKNTEGVAKVVNNLTVRTETARDTGEISASPSASASPHATEAGRTTGEVISDATILTKIKTQILAEGIVGTNVDVKDGVVMLKGDVESAKEKSQAEEIAKKTDGVKSVKNMLMVKKNK